VRFFGRQTITHQKIKQQAHFQDITRLHIPSYEATVHTQKKTHLFSSLLLPMLAPEAEEKAQILEIVKI
jgi:hypothetical protein